MQTRLLPLLAVPLLLSGDPVSLAANEAKPAKIIRLLTVGNSFSGNATHYLPDLVRASGNVLVHRTAAVGGASLDLHWNKAQLHEKNPDDKAGRYATGRSLKEELLSEKWDFVTIQQASIKSHDLATYRPFAGQLRDYIKKYAPDAELLLHETWEYRRDDPRFAIKVPKPGEPATADAMYQGLAAAYTAIATELGVRRIPVGDAFHLANIDPIWGYRPDAKFDFKSAKPPALPDQTHSLNVGWQWKTTNGRPSLKMDGHHAGLAGEYLGACVWLEVLFDASAVDNAFLPKGLDPAYARFLQETAHRAVADSGAQVRPPGR